MTVLPTRVLTRYLASRVLIAIGLTSLLLVGVYTLVEFIREARALAGDYGAVQMLWFLLQTMPRRLYDIFPFAALIGTLLGLGALAGGNELVAMRAAGFDRRRIVARVMLVLLLCLTVLMLMAEWMIPDLESEARAQRQQARTGDLGLGHQGVLWLRDGSLMMRLGQSAWLGPDRIQFGEVLVYRIEPDMSVSEILSAERAHHGQGYWTFSGVVRMAPGDDTALVESSEHRLASGISHDLIAATVSRPRLLSLRDIGRMQSFLRANDLDVEPYRLAFWARVYYPVNVLVMVLIGLPFVFRNARSSARGLNLFAGVSLGLLFFVLQRITQNLALLLPLPLWFSALLPALLTAMLGSLLLRRLH